MSPLRINGSTSGSVSLDCPAVGGNNTLVLPGGNGSAGQYLQTNGSGALSWSTSGLPTLALTRATAVASTSGTSIDFTGIPSTAKRITIMFDGVSTNGTSEYQIQLGTSSGVETTGYAGYAKRFSTTGLNSSGLITAGLRVVIGTSAAAPYIGHAVFTNVSGNIWVGTSNIWQTTNDDSNSAGTNKTLSGVLDRVRITTANGTDAFDAGTINIMYEG